MKKINPMLSKILAGFIVIAALNVITGLYSTALAETVDKDVVLLNNGNILTMNPKQPTASAMAVKEGKIIAVGDLDAVKKAAGDSYEYIDVEGKTVVPGFIESHEHLVQYGGILALPDLSPMVTPSVKEALKKLKKEGKPNKDGYIYAFGVDQTLYTEKRGPSRQELDELFPDQPVIILHISGHGAFVNSKALEMAGVTKDTPDPQGGTFVKDKNGELTGFCNGLSAWTMVGDIPPITKQTTLNSARFHAERGFTSTTEQSIFSPEMLIFLKEVTQDPDFPVRVYGGMFITMKGLDEIAPKIANYETDLFKVPYIKTWTDGSMQGGTAYLSEPYYKLKADTKKGALGPQEKFNKELVKILKLGFNPAIHTNGDAAVDLGLNAIEYGRKETGRKDLRPHLIHTQYVREDQFDRIAKLGNIGMSFMTVHVYYWGDLHREVILGPERAPHISSMKSAVERGIPYAMHNDPPVTPPNALENMWIAVNRLTSSGKELGPDLRITPEQALLAYTREAAMTLGIEDEVGTLAPGMYADFVVLSDDPLKIDPMKIRDIQIEATVMNGRVTYYAPADEDVGEYIN
jgi:predicted amidohydrolase YtcJ